MEILLMSLMPENREILSLCMDYGLRVGDVLNMKVDDLRKSVWSFKEEKTGKRRRVKLSEAHRRACLSLAGKIYVFEHRTDYKRHRTRQAVYKDIKRIAKMFRLKYISPHSFRKVYAVEQYKKTDSLQHVQKLLNHGSPEVTVLYALADELSQHNQKVITKLSK